MKNLSFLTIAMVLSCGAAGLMASSSSPTVRITNNSSDGVSLALYDAAGIFISTGSPLFLQPDQSFPLQSSYSVQEQAPCDPSHEAVTQCQDRQKKMSYKTIVVKSIRCTFQHSRLSFTIPMPTSPINIIPTDLSIVTLINDSSSPIQVSFYDKDGKAICDEDGKPTTSSLTYADFVQAGGPIDKVYLPSNVAKITIDLGSGLIFSMPRPTQASSNIFSNQQTINNQVVKVTNNSEDFVQATLPNGTTIQFASGQSHYIPTTVHSMSIAKALNGTWGPATNIVMHEADFNLFA